MSWQQLGIETRLKLEFLIKIHYSENLLFLYNKMFPRAIFIFLSHSANIYSYLLRSLLIFSCYIAMSFVLVTQLKEKY